MDLYDNFVDPLLQEVLMGMADKFFGTRKHLEDMMDLFISFVETLRKMEADVADRAGFLNYLFLDEKRAADFYKLINAEVPELMLKGNLSDNSVPKYIPFALTDKGEFIKFVEWAYDKLQKECEEYNNGKYDNEEAEDDEISVNYKLLVNMCELINKEIDKINNDMSPLAALQYVKKFNPENMDKERVTGSLFHGEHDRLDKRLAYQPIDFDSFQLKKYPELPKSDETSAQIRMFCKKIYSDNKADIKRLLSDLKKKIHGD